MHGRGCVTLKGQNPAGRFDLNLHLTYTEHSTIPGQPHLCETCEPIMGGTVETKISPSTTESEILVRAVVQIDECACPGIP
jgi:hypothetical protein